MNAYQNGMPIMTYIPKESNPSIPPKYFRNFQKKVETFIDTQKEINIQLLEFIKEQRKVNEEQRKFNKWVVEKFDKLDKKLDNLVKKNNLKE